MSSWQGEWKRESESERILKSMVAQSGKNFFFYLVFDFDYFHFQKKKNL